ncbi:MAG: hypothetical protein GY730_07960 [bacterium]|nr:hypothetical protein [bacterium]
MVIFLKREEKKEENALSSQEDYSIIRSRLTKDTLRNFHGRRKLIVKEKEAWATGEHHIRQEITNHYIFQVLKYLFLGDVFWVASEVIDPITATLKFLSTAHLKEFFLVIVLIFFLLGVGNVLRYMKLLSSDQKGV